MKTATFDIVGISPYGQSSVIQSPRGDKETAQDHENRTWRERMHVDEQGIVYIPPMAVKNCLSECAKFLSVQIPGKGKSTYTKHFEAGLLCMEPISLGVKAADVKGQWLFVPSDGKRGGSKRVMKCFPVIPTGWRGSVSVLVVDDTITQDVFKYHLEQAGQFIGLGFFRPRNNGFYGRFTIEKFKWNA